MKPVLKHPRLAPGRELIFSVLLWLPVAAFAQTSQNTINTAFDRPAVSSSYYATQQAEPQVISIDDLFAITGQKLGDTLPVTLGAPANNNCSAGLGPAYTLFPGAACTNGSLSGSNPSPLATVEAGETFGCMAGPPDKTVWYNFTATATSMWVSIESTGAIVCSQNFGLRVYNYSGACPPASASEVGCRAYTAYSSLNVFNVLSLTGLTIGNTYLIQVGQNPNCGRYPFCIRIGVPNTCTTCANVCGPMCNYAGPTAPTPAQVTGACTGYPLSPPMNELDVQTNCFTFTAPNDTISLQMIVQSYCGGGMYQFDYTLYTAGCSVVSSGSIFSNNTITNLVPGTNYRICYTFQTACSTTGSIWPYVYTTSTVLPVELLYFDAYSASGKTELYWSTASETNSREFVVERTRDGVVFEIIGKIRAAGNSITTNNYRFTDENPISGTSYYRLRQIDLDGSEYPSRLIVARHPASVSEMSLFPNPAGNHAVLRMFSGATNTATVRVIDALGKMVWMRDVSLADGMNFIPMELTDLADGIYAVQISCDRQVTSLRLIRN